MSVAEVIGRHEKSGRYFTADGIQSFVLDQGSGEPVVLLHGVPASSFLYRKVVPALAKRGLRGIAFDFPGLGLADRPEGYDYTWTGLGRFSAAAVDALGLDRFHLVVHDIGGPVGFELAAAMPDRIASLTILDTPIHVSTFKRPWVMEPFASKWLGPIWLAFTRRGMYLPLMWNQGVPRSSGIPHDELNAYPTLLKRGDGGKAFLAMMRGFELTAEKESLYLAALKDAPFPIQIVWGRDDPALKAKTHGAAARRAVPEAAYFEVPGKHFYQEDQFEAIAEKVANLAAGNTANN